MNLIIFGPPGAGKGTQADFIVNKYDLFQLSTGEVLRNEINLPLGLPEELGVNGLIFIDAGTLTKTSESGETVQDELKLRASTGFGFSWLSPFGPVKFYLSKALIKENYDKTEIFRFSFGTTY